MFPKRAVGFLVALHVLFAAIYAAVAPYRTPGLIEGIYFEDIGAPDELAHSKYVQWLAEGKGLPRAAPPDMPTYEAHQPPLYYALAAAWAKAGFCRDFDEPRTGFWLRLMSALIGGLGVLGAARMAWAASQSPPVTKAAAAVYALLPMNVGVSAAISNDPLLNALSAWTIALLVEAYRDGWTGKKAVWVGALIGLALATKTSAFALFLPLFLCLAMSKSKAKPALFLAISAMALLVASPVWLKNYLLYHDPFMLKTFASNWPGGELARAGGTLRGLARYTIELLRSTAMSFFGLQGYMAVGFPFWVYALLTVFAGFLVYGAVQAARGKSGEQRRTDWLVGSLLVGALLLYIRFNIDYRQPQARYFFTALAPIAYFLAVGFAHWFGGRLERAYFWLAAGMAGLNLWMAGLMASSFRTMQEDLELNGGPSAYAKPS